MSKGRHKTLSLPVVKVVQHRTSVNDRFEDLQRSALSAQAKSGSLLIGLLVGLLVSLLDFYEVHQFI